MKYVNHGASCETCKNKDGKKRRACRRCMTVNGFPGYEPGEGVKVEIYTNLVNGQTVRRVLA